MRFLKDKPLNDSLIKLSALFAVTILVSSCGGGGGGSDEANESSLLATQPFLSFSSTKRFEFTWSDSEGAEFYRLLENSDGISGFSQIGSDIPQGEEATSIYAPLHDRAEASYILQTCAADTCVDSSEISVMSNFANSIGYIKASNPESGDNFGRSISLSGNGNTLAVGVYSESSGARGINQSDNDSIADSSGAVYVYHRSEFEWVLQAYIKANNAEALDWFGWAVSISDDGNSLVVGARFEDSNSRGVNGDQNNSAYRSGAAYVFERENESWTQTAFLKASNAEAEDNFGNSVSISGDGFTIAIGANEESGQAEGINGDEFTESWLGSGATYVFTKENGNWEQQAYIKASNNYNGNSAGSFGDSVSLSDNGNILAVGAGSESSNATGVDGDQLNTSLTAAGAVYTFAREDNQWRQTAYIKASNTEEQDGFGRDLTLSGDGKTLAVSAAIEDGGSIGINGVDSDNSERSSGAVYVFSSTGDSWQQDAYIKTRETNAFDYFGSGISLNYDGTLLAAGKYTENHLAMGVDDIPAVFLGAPSSGAVYLYKKVSGQWTDYRYIKASNTGTSDWFGISVSLSDDGDTLAVGASNEDSDGSSQQDNSILNAGAVYIF